MTIKSLKY